LAERHAFTISKTAADILNKLEALSYDDKLLRSVDMRHLPIVTGASSNHYREAMVLIESFQAVFPDDQMYYYDLGLTSAQRKEVGINVGG